MDTEVMKFMLSYLLDCGENDIWIFEKLADDEEYFSDAVDELRNMGEQVTAESVWKYAIGYAVSDVFGDDYDLIDVDWNGSYSEVLVDKKDAKSIKGFNKKAKEFKEKTGFDVKVWDRPNYDD